MAGQKQARRKNGTISLVGGIRHTWRHAQRPPSAATAVGIHEEHDHEKALRICPPPPNERNPRWGKVGWLNLFLAICALLVGLAAGRTAEEKEAMHEAIRMKTACAKAHPQCL